MTQHFSHDTTADSRRVNTPLRAGSILRALGLMLQRDAAGVARPMALESRCAWCDREQGVRLPADRLVSHGICPRHLAEMKADLEQRRVAA